MQTLLQCREFGLPNMLNRTNSVIFIGRKLRCVGPDELAPPLVNKPQIKIEDGHVVEVMTDSEEALEMEPATAGSS